MAPGKNLLFLGISILLSTTTAKQKQEQRQQQQQPRGLLPSDLAHRTLMDGLTECAGCDTPTLQCSGVTIDDTYCQPCATGQTWWPCNVQNECYCKSLEEELAKEEALLADNCDLPLCNVGDNGYKIVPFTKCTMYVTCNSGIPGAIQSCPEGEAFSTRINACNVMSLVTCPEDPTCPPSIGPTPPPSIAPQNSIDGGESDDYYCGTDWMDAYNNCHKHCPTGEDAECADLNNDGVQYSCQYDTACSFKDLVNDDGEVDSTPSPVAGYSVEILPIDDDVPSSAPSRSIDQVITTGSREDLQLGGQTTSSYGYIFNIRTQPDAGVAIISGFDFYTESTSDVYFELWTRLGTFKGHKGTYDGWDLIATGTVQGSGIGRYTSIPPELYTPVAIPGGGGEEGTRAFYLTLQSIDLVYKLGTILDGDSGYSDERPHAETEDIAIYQGEGILWYPFPDPEEVIFYRYPREYLGAVYYNRLPCRPYSLYGVINELPCPLVPTGSPTGPPPTKSPVTDEPTVSPVFSPTRLPSDSPTVSPIMGATPAPVEPTEFPTESPTESKFPTMEPTTSQPTMSPVVPMRANIVTTLRNVPDREMTVREVEKYVEIMTTFLRRHTESSMTLDGIDWWHGQLTQVDAKEGTVAEGAEGDEEGEDGDDEKEQEEAEEQSPQVARGANRRQLQKNKRPPATPQVVAMDITLILRISISTLPIEMLGNMAKVAIEENEEELLALLREQQAFYTFFKSADGVACKVIEEVTNPPTLSPITAAEAAALAAAEEEEEDEVLVEEEDGGVGFGVFVGLGIGFLWCCLTAISVAYLMSARGEMEEQRDMEDLLKAEKHNPLTDKETDGDDEKGGEKTDAAGNVVVDDGTDNPKSLRRGSTVPMGDTEDDFEKSGLTNNMQTDSDDSVTWDHTKNDRLTVEAKDELRKSTNSPLEEEDFGEFDTGTGTPMTRRAASNSNLAKIKERFGDGPQPGAYSYKPARNPRPGAQSMVVTAQESSAILDGDISKRRYSSSALAEKMKERKSLARSVIRGGEAEMSSTPHKRLSQSVVVKSGMGTDKAKQRKSITKSFIKGDGGSSSSSTSPPKRGLAKSMVTPQKSNIEDLEMSLAKNNAKILQRAKTMDVDSKNGGTTAEGGLRKSTTRKVGGVASSMRRSSTKHGSHDNLRKSSRSSHSHAASLRRSSKDDSHETLHTLKYKGESDDANMTMKQSGTKAREKRNSVATGEPLRKSDNEIKKAPRRRSDRLGQSMMY